MQRKQLGCVHVLQLRKSGVEEVHRCTCQEVHNDLVIRMILQRIYKLLYTTLTHTVFAAPCKEVHEAQAF